MEIKEGDVFEVPYIAHEMKQLHHYEELNYDPKSVIKSLNNVLKNGGKLWVLKDGEDFAGVCIGAVGPSFYDHSQMIGHCIDVGVLPKYKKTQWLNKLLKTYEEWSDAKIIVCSSSDPTTQRRMKRSGYRVVETKLMRVENG